jgi:RecA-family ATPase
VTQGKFGYTLDELEKLLSQKPVRYVVEGLLPADEVHVVVGDSGLGKTPWAYQLGLCVAEGKPFLGHQVRKCPVLYYDMENGYEEIVDVSRALCGHLGIKGSPKDFIIIPYDGNPPPIEKAV